MAKDTIELEILKASSLEHFKYSKDLDLVLPLEHPKRKKALDELNKINAKIQQIVNSRNVNTT